MEKKAPVSRIGRSRHEHLVGTFALHNDGRRSHAALILGVCSADPEAFLALFLTSNPHWNPDCRKATEEEIRMLHMKPLDKPSYLAPVIRPKREFPSYRLGLDAKGLRKYHEEFAHSFVGVKAAPKAA